MTEKLVIGFIGVIVSLAILPLMANESLGVPFVPKVGDFNCREISFLFPVPLPPVELEDQFVTSQHLLDSPHLLCSNGNKTNAGGFPDSQFPITFPNQHYVPYGILDAIPLNIPVQLTDQFGTTDHIVGAARELWVPASKTHDGDFFPIDPSNDIHWKCYDITQVPLITSFNFTDQFHNSTITITNAKFLCNPTIKGIESVPDSGNFDLKFGSTTIPDHLKCYGLGNEIPSVDFPSTVQIQEQFNVQDGDVFGTNTICLVAEKVVFGSDSLVGGTLIPIDTNSLLVAGAYKSASWMIPILISGTGIGLAVFTLKRR